MKKGKNYATVEIHPNSRVLSRLVSLAINGELACRQINRRSNYEKKLLSFDFR